MPIIAYNSADVRIDALREHSVAVIGYGNQGRAHALNLRDSGIVVFVGQRHGDAGSGFRQAVEDGFGPTPIESAVQDGHLVVMALPDEVAAEIYDTQVGPHLRPGQALGFVHGFNIRYGFIRPPQGVNVIMVAPKGPGTLLRSLYIEGKGLPALLAVEHDASGQAEATALAWAAGIGAGRAGVVRTTFAAETETDLFGEQTVLCGGVTALCQVAFQTLVEAGYEPEFAYLECVHELKQIVDLIYVHGLDGMRQRISNTAEYGDLTRGPRVIGAEVRTAMKRMLEEIRDGRFAQEWTEEYRKRGTGFRAAASPVDSSAFEKAGENVRKLMPWLPKG